MEKPNATLLKLHKLCPVQKIEYKSVLTSVDTCDYIITLHGWNGSKSKFKYHTLENLGSKIQFNLGWPGLLVLREDVKDEIEKYYGWVKANEIELAEYERLKTKFKDGV